VASQPRRGLGPSPNRPAVVPTRATSRRAESGRSQSPRLAAGFGLAVWIWSLALLCPVVAARAATIKMRPVSALDDAVETIGGSMSLNSGSLQLGDDAGGIATGIRWSGLAVPAGSTITAAWIEFTSSDSQSGPASLSLQAQAADSPPAFDAASGNISTRTLTTAAVSWSPAAWKAGTVQRTPDLRAVLQEVVNRPGWTSGNAFVIVVAGMGRRTAFAVDASPVGSPLIHVDYMAPLGPGSSGAPAAAGPVSNPRTEASEGLPPQTGDSVDVDVPPVAVMTVTQLATPELTVSADASASTDTDASPIATYHFDFGDGSPVVDVGAPASTAQHTYAAAGPYTVTLTITDTGNLTSAPVTNVITVAPPPDAPPVAGLTVAQLATPALTVRADASASTDTDITPIAIYHFDFGDGSAVVDVSAPADTAQHTYAAAGPYTVTLTITDTGNLTSAPFTNVVTVAPPPDAPPVAGLTVTQDAAPALTVSADASASTDPDAFPIATYHFDFGDGSPVVDVTAPADTAQHTYAAAGTYTVTLSATDTGNLTSAPVTSSVAVNGAPVAHVAMAQVATPALTVRADASGSTDTDSFPIATYHFDFGDGSPVVDVTAPADTAQHTYAAAGTYTVTLSATDTGNLTSAPVTSSITVNPAPILLILERRIATSTDDAEEFADSSMYLSSSDLELIHDTTDQTVGMRWTGLTIPPGSTITAAYIQFGAKESQNVATALSLHAQAADNPPTFGSPLRNVSSRPVTSAATSWAPVAWNAGETGPNQRTPDLSASIQEVVSRPGWASGNALVMIVTGTGHRTAWAYDGSSTLAPLLHVEYLTTPPADLPPVARLSVSQLATPALTVRADASASTDTDATPIASYHFDFGDGSAVVNTTAPTSTAQHTYAVAGTYTVTVTATDTGNLTSAPASGAVTVSGTPDLPPVARLTATQLATPPLTVSADGSGSTDTDATPIASYHFNFGDGSAVVNTTAPTSTAQHTYAAAGTYTVTLTVTDTGNNTSGPASSTITVTPSTTARIAVYVGYYDTHHHVNLKPKPNPWLGSPGVVFVGVADDNSNNWDSACLRVDNLTAGPLNNVVVTADLGSHHFALWGTRTIPLGSKLILAQTSPQNFDGSDTNPAGCYGCDPAECLTLRSSDIPVVHVSLAGSAADYRDTGQVLNTGGYDGAGCPYLGGPLPQTRYDESHDWQQIFSNAPLVVASAMNDSASTRTPSEAEDALPGTLSLAPPSPNPTRGDLAVRFMLPTTSETWIGIYDLSGRLVRTCVDNTLRAGVYSFRLDLADVRPGVYFLRLWTPHGTRRERFALTR